VSAAVIDHPDHREEGVSVPLSGLIEPGQGWRAYAECGLDTIDLFHPAADDDGTGSEAAQDRRYREDAALKICGTCAVRLACLAYVESIEARTGATDPGVWGGTTPQDRRRNQRSCSLPGPLRRTAGASRSLPRYWDTKAVRAADAIDSDSVRSLARRGVPAEQIANWLQMSVDAVRRAVEADRTEGEVAA
jgi:hypothetical protein